MTQGKGHEGEGILRRNRDMMGVGCVVEVVRSRIVTVPSKRRGVQSEHQQYKDMGRSRQQGYVQERGIEIRILLREGDEIEGMGIVIRNEGGMLTNFLGISARIVSRQQERFFINAFALMFPGPQAPGCCYVRQYHSMYNLRNKQKKPPLLYTLGLPKYYSSVFIQVYLFIAQ